MPPTLSLYVYSHLTPCASSPTPGHLCWNAHTCLQNRLAWVLQRKQWKPSPLRLISPAARRAKIGSDAEVSDVSPRAPGESSLLGGQPLEAYMPRSVRPRPNPYPDVQPPVSPVPTAAVQSAPQAPVVLQKPERAAPGARAEGTAAAVDTRQALPKVAAAATADPADPARDMVQGMIQVRCCVWRSTRHSAQHGRHRPFGWSNVAQPALCPQSMSTYA